MRNLIFNLTFIIFAIYSSSSFTADREKLDKVIEYFKILEYDNMVKREFESCIREYEAIELDNRKSLTTAVSIIESQRKLKPGTLVIDEVNFAILLDQLHDHYTNYAIESCKLAPQNDDLLILASEYAKYVTSKDMDKIIAFAKSSIGKIEIIASKRAMEDGFKLIDQARIARKNKIFDDLNRKSLETIAKYFKVNTRENTSNKKN